MPTAQRAHATQTSGCWPAVLGGVYFVASALAWFFLYLAASLGPGSGITSAQASFIHFALWLIPAACLWTFATTVGSARARLLDVLRVSLTLGGMLVSVASVAMVLFPKYPQAGPHELIANALLMPAVVGGGVYLCRRLDQRELRKKMIVGWSLLAAFVVGCDYRFYAQPLRNVFPVATRDLHYARYCEMQDIFEYGAMGQVSAADADEIMRGLELRPSSGMLPVPDVRQPIEWWRPPNHKSHSASFDHARSAGAEDWEGCTLSGLYAGGYLYLALSCRSL